MTVTPLNVALWAAFALLVASVEAVETALDWAVFAFDVASADAVATEVASPASMSS